MSRAPFLLLASLFLFVTSPLFAATLKIDSDPAGARIYLDNTPVGVTPKIFTSVDKISPGEHSLRLEKEGFSVFTSTVKVEADRVNLFRFPLVLAAPAATTVSSVGEGGGGAGQLLLGGWEVFAGLAGIGGILGFCVGYATKKIAKVVAIGVGLLVISIQFLASQKLLTVNWSAFESMTSPYLAQGGVSSLGNLFLGMVTVNLPFAGPFVVGFWLGLKKG